MWRKKLGTANIGNAEFAGNGLLEIKQNVRAGTRNSILKSKRAINDPQIPSAKLHWAKTRLQVMMTKSHVHSGVVAID